MNTTTYGYENPTTGDLSKGINGWMAAINFDITRLDGHSHNGVDSVLLTFASFVPATITALAAGWTTNAGGAGLPSSGYVQTVATPAGVVDINNQMVKFLINNAGARQYQPLELFYTRLTGTTFNLYSNDNSIDVLCVFK